MTLDALDSDAALTATASLDTLESVQQRILWLATSIVHHANKVRSTPSGVKVGGHKVGILSGGHRDWLMDRTKTDFTLRGLVAELAMRGVKVDYVQVWRFVHAEGLSFKKKRAARRAAPAEDRQAARAMEEVSGPA